MKPNHPTIINAVAYGTAVALACFSSAIATYGLSRFVPDAGLIVAAMGLLFECAKLTSFSLLHRPLPRLLKITLAVAGLILMAANVAGVAGFLSSAYTARQLDADAKHAETATVTAAEVADLRRQLDAADSQLAAARTGVLRAKADRDRIKAAQAAADRAQGERDRIADRLREATAAQAKGEASRIAAGAEYAAVVFIAAALGTNPDATARAVIAAIAALPDTLALLLLLAAGYAPHGQRTAVLPRKAATKPRKVKTRNRLGRGLNELEAQDKVTVLRR
jgi:hypothetical protein